MAIDGLEPVVGRLRKLPGTPGLIQRGLFVALPLVGVGAVLDLTLYVGIAIIREQYLGLFLGLALAAAFLTYPRAKSGPWHRVPWYDWAGALLGLAAGLYLTATYSTLMFAGTSTHLDLVLGVIAIGAVLEVVRRSVGWLLVLLVASFFLYARFSHLIPGVLGAKGWSWERLIFFTYTDSNSLLGLPLAIGATMVMAFVLFGEVLLATGGGTLFTDFALAAMGRFRGGPAKVAVVASSLFGTISGSAVANVAVDGMITIPMMKRAGYKPHVAAAVEAVASTGGQIMPPVMGAAAFIMADMLGISYAAVAIAALVPALLYYLALFVQVDLEAGKEGLRGLPPEELPSLGPIVKMSWLVVIPLMILIYTLFILYLPPARAALISVAGAVGVSLFRREVRRHLRRLVIALENCGRILVELAVILGAAGFIIGIMTGTGLGAKFSMALVSMSQGNEFLLLVMTAAVAIVMGMGMPTTAVYLLLAIFVAPAMVQMGFTPLAAHLFIFYYGILSVVTPPVAFASFTAASLVGTDPMRTGWAGMRLGILGYIVPFLFVFSPSLLLRGSPGYIVFSVVTATLGTVILGMVLEGYFLRRLSLLQRVLLGLGALGLLIPLESGAYAARWLANIVGAAIAFPLILWEWRIARRERVLALKSVRAPA